MSPPQDDVSLTLGDDGIGALVFDRPGSRVNLLGFSTIERLDALLATVERAAAEGALRLLLLRSAKPGVWLAGHDLREVAEITDPVAATAQALYGQGVMRRLERLSVPTVAAIDGACLGSGTELALACAYRLASDAPATRLGLPETQMGILPGLGGTVRLPRLIGLQQALEMILTGRSVDARGALRLGLVDRVLPAAGFEAQVRSFLGERLRQGRTRTGARRGMPRRLLEDTAPGRRLIFSRAARRLPTLRGGLQPAPRRALQVVAEGVALPLEKAFEREAQALGELVVTPEAKALLHAFRVLQEAKHPPAAAPPQRVEEAAVLGAGRAGAEVAHLLAFHGLPVRLKDRDHDRLLRARAHVRALFAEQASRGLLRAAGADDRLALVGGALGYGGFGTLDVVVEATTEEPRLRAAALRQAEEHVRDDCLLATAGAGPVSALQEALRLPERMLGLHLFPLPRVRLVEIVPGERTSPATLATAHAFIRRLGKTPLVVADAPGFLLRRLLVPYVGEAVRLLQEGATIQQVDGALRGFGMAIPPLRLADDLGLDEVAALSRRLAAALGERLEPPPALDALVRAGRRGREWGRGFYRYHRDGEPRGTEPELYRLLHGTAPAPAPTPPPDAEVQQRVVLAVVAEALRALEEGVVRSAAAVDVATLHGLGFPAARGGLLWWADAQGPEALARSLHACAERHGDRYQPPPLLQRLAEAGARLHAPAPLSADAGQPASGMLL